MAYATFLGIGILTLIGLCLLTPSGQIVLMCAAGIPALFALGWLSYFAGRGAAKVRNSFAREAARTDLEKIMRARQEAHPAH